MKYVFIIYIFGISNNDESQASRESLVSWHEKHLNQPVAYTQTYTTWLWISNNICKQRLWFFLFLHFARKSNKAYGNFICFYAFLTSNCLSVFRVVRGDYTFLPCEAEKRSQTGCLYSVCLTPSIETMKYHKHSHNGGKKKQTWHQLYWHSVKYLLYSQCGRIELDINMRSVSSVSISNVDLAEYMTMVFMFWRLFFYAFYRTETFFLHRKVKTTNILCGQNL